jgi:sulfur carrier protein
MEKQMEGRRHVAALLRELGFNPESHLVIRNGQLLTRDDMVREDDTVEILSTISGG